MITDIKGRDAEENSSQDGIDWSTYAEVYDTIPELTAEYGKNLAILREFLTRDFKTSQLKVLDLGAGTGNYIQDMHSYLSNAQYWHVDSSEAMTSRALAKYEAENIPVTIINDSVSDVQFEPRTFDLIICINALYAMEPIEKTLLNIKRWLKDDGAFFTIDFGRKQRVSSWLGGFITQTVKGDVHLDTLKTFFSKAPGLFAQGLKGTKGQTKGNYWMHSTEEFVERIEGAGFRVQKSGQCYRNFCDYAIARPKATARPSSLLETITQFP